jgi:hypothetical protein
MKIPNEILERLEQEARGIAFGTVALQIILHDGQARFKLSREISIVPGKETSGALPKGDVK